MLLSTTTYYEDQLPKEVLSNLLKDTMTVAGSDISIPSSCSLPIIFSIKTLTFQLTA